MALALFVGLGLGGLEEGEHPLDVGLAALVVQDAEPQREASLESRRGDEPGAAPLERGHDPGVARVVEVAPAEAEDPERGGRQQVEVSLSEAADRARGQVDRRRDRRAKGVDPEVSSEIQSLSARAERVSCRPRSRS